MTAAPHTTGPSERRRSGPRWLRDLIRSEVIGGHFHGGLLPSEAELMLAYSAPRATVRGALDLLRREGLVHRVQGTGTLAVDQRLAARLLEVHGAEEQQTLSPGLSTRVLAREVVPMPRAVATQLDEQPGTDCLLYEYVGYLYGDALGVYTNYVRFPQAALARTARFDSHWYAMLAAAGLGVGETELVIEVLCADDSLAALLGIQAGRPILGMEQVIRDPDGRPYDFAILRSRADRLSLVSRAVSPRLNLTCHEEDR